VEVDVEQLRAGAEPDPRWAEFAEMRLEVRVCKADREARNRRRKWVTAALTGAVGSLLAALIYAVQAIDARGAASESDRQRREMTIRHESEIRTLQTQHAASAALLNVLLQRPSNGPRAPRDAP
jgi:hypothetical protein